MKNKYRIVAIILGVLSVLGTFLISGFTLTQYNHEFVFVLTFLALIIALFGILIVFLLTKSDTK